MNSSLSTVVFSSISTRSIAMVGTCETHESETHESHLTVAAHMSHFFLYPACAQETTQQAYAGGVKMRALTSTSIMRRKALATEGSVSLSTNSQ